MTDAELLAHLDALRSLRTDSRHVEAKRSHSALPKRLWETLSAFSNSVGGGAIILGVAEDGGFVVVGVNEPARIQADLQSMCAEMEPRVAAVIDVKVVDGKHLVVAEVPELNPEQKPCFYRPGGLTNGAFVRQGDADRKLGSYEIQVMLSARAQPTFDREPVDEATLDDLDEKALEVFLRRVHERRPRLRDRTDGEILEMLRVLVHDRKTKQLRPSLAGMIVFGRDPQRFFEQFAVLFTAFPGRELGERGVNNERLLDDARLEGNLGQIVGHTLTRIASNMRHPRREYGAGRTIDSEIPRAALAEALTNALAHRDLSPQARGTAVHVHLFGDRLVITNPGGLYGPTTIDTLGHGGLTSARNATLMQLLEDAVDPDTGQAIAEHRGTGIPAMLRELRDVGLAPPRFEDTIATFRVILSRPPVRMTGENQNWTRFGAYYLGGARPADALAKRQHSRGATGTKPRRGDRRTAILALLEHESLTRAEIEAALELHQTSVSRWLRLMRTEGTIELTTMHEKDHAARYRLADRMTTR